MPYFDGVAGRVYYKAWRAPGPRRATVVFLHGFGEHSGLYHRLGNALAVSGIELWALDEIGHGLSEGPRAVIRSIDDLVENGRRLTALAVAGGAEAPLILAGHSLGAAAAALTIARTSAPFAGAILSGAPIGPVEWVISAAAGDEEFELSAAQLSTDPFYLDELENDPLAFTSEEDTSSLLRVLPATWDELDRSLGDVSIPILLVHGEYDPVVPVSVARGWAARLAGTATLAEFAGALHDVLNESVHRDVTETIIDFITSTIGRDAALRGGHGESADHQRARA